MLVTTPAQRFLIQSELEALAKTCEAARNPSKSAAPQANGPPAAASRARGSSPPPKRARAADLVLRTPQAQPVSVPPSCTEVQGCLAKGQSNCRVSGFNAETRQGTAFFDAKTKCLWTARHVVDPQIRELLLQLEHAQDNFSLDPRDIAAAFNVPFVLKDQSHKVVFDSTGPDQARVGMLLPSLITDEKAASGLFMGRQERHYDSMCLKLSRDVETSVAIRGGRISDGDELYIGGYPVLWGQNKKVAVQHKLLFSQGHKMNWTERKTKIYAPALDEATKESPGEPSLVDQAPTGALAWVLEWTAYGKNSLTNIAVPGMSGSPGFGQGGPRGRSIPRRQHRLGRRARHCLLEDPVVRRDHHRPIGFEYRDDLRCGHAGRDGPAPLTEKPFGLSSDVRFRSNRRYWSTRTQVTKSAVGRSAGDLNDSR